jgi:hypothetical protein
MRTLHTADWHIGQTLAGYRRENEHRAVLNEVIRIVVVIRFGSGILTRLLGRASNLTP